MARSNTIVLEVPKAGSRSLVHAARAMGRLTAEGHISIADTIRQVGCVNPKVIAVIRDPVDRFCSALAFHFGWRRGFSLDEAMAQTDGHITFRPQVSFLEAKGHPHDLRLFPLERIADAFAEIGQSPVWRNAARRRFDRAEVEAHPRFPDIMARYEADFALRGALDGVSG